MNAPTAHPAYPTTLRHEVRRAARLSHALARLMERVDPADPSFVWLLGRADEVRAVVGAAVRDWQEGRVEEPRASERVRSYVHGLYEVLRAFDRSRARASGPRTRAPSDTIVDA
jgi:hypothetical protein